jgi:uncharacterized protein (DUF1697 family)
MSKYVALLRGIGPGNPNMHNDKLRGVLEDLGFKNVKSVISSGNVLFESSQKDMAKMEAKIEAAWPKQLGFNSMTIVCSQQHLQEIVDANPFKNLTHSANSYLLVTFFKMPAKLPFKLPYQPEGKPFKIVAATDSVVFTTTDTTTVKTPDVMTWLEKQFGKDITSRTWLTINRILKKMEV